MVFVRREIFASKFRHVVEAELARRVANKVNAPVEIHLVPWWKRAAHVFTPSKLSTIPEVSDSSESTARERTQEKDNDKDRGRGIASRLRPDMIRRMNDAPKLVNPSGYISEGHTPQVSSAGLPHPPDGSQYPSTIGTVEFETLTENALEEAEAEARRQLSKQSESGSEDSIDRVK